MINGISSSSFNYQIPESQVERPEGFQGTAKDTFVRDESRDLEMEQNFRQMGEEFSVKHRKHKAPKQPDGGVQGPNGSNGPSEVHDGVSMFPNREGYKTDFLGIDYPMPTLGDSIKDKASHLIDHPDEIELKYNHFSIVQNAERKQCFFTACNIDGNQSQAIKRSGSWVLDGRIPLEHQVGDAGYERNDIDKGHMVRRLDPAWGSTSKLGSTDTFVYTNSALQHHDLNTQEWLNLEDHVLSSAHGQKMTVLTGPVFSESDRSFTNHGKLSEPVQIPEKFWKVVVWKDDKTNQLKQCAFVMDQSEILDQDSSLFKGGFNPSKFSMYQVPISQLEQMTDLHFGPAQDITPETVKLTAANGYTPQNL